MKGMFANILDDFSVQVPRTFLPLLYLISEYCCLAIYKSQKD